MINKSNIEEKMFDYFEGNLSSGEADDLKDFVDQNPDLKTDFDAWQNSYVPQENFEFKHMDDLLVDEKKAPRVFGKWSLGGAFLLAVSILSLSVFMNNKEDASLTANIEEQEGNSELLANSKKSTQLEESVLSGADVQIEKSNTDDKQVSEMETLKDASSSGATIQVNNIETTAAKANNSTVNSHSLVSQLPKKSSNSIFQEKNLEKGDLGIVDASYQGASWNSILEQSLNKSEYNYSPPTYNGIVFNNTKDPQLLISASTSLEDNGSFAGHGDGIRFNYGFRSEWTTALKDNYFTHLISADAYVKALKGAVAVQYYKDVIGHNMVNSDGFSLIYSPKFEVKGKYSIEPNVRYNYMRKMIDFGQISLGTNNDIKDPRNGVLFGSYAYADKGVTTQSATYSDFGAGLLFSSKQLFVGIAVDHLLNPSYRMDDFDQDITVPFKIAANIGTQFRPSKTSKMLITPNVRYLQFGEFQQLWLNSTVSYKGLLVAAGVATDKSGLFSLGYLSKGVRLTYSLGISELPTETSSGSAFGMSHQAGVRFDLKPKKK